MPVKDILQTRTRQKRKAEVDPQAYAYQLYRAECCRESLFDFVQEAWHVIMPYTARQDNWHIGCICEHLEALTALEIRKLIINMPPRHMKSLLTSVFWFCWAWLKKPNDQWIYSSYDKGLLDRDSMRCRDIIRSSWYQEWFGNPFEIAGDADAKDYFKNTLQGSRLTTTVDGRGTGLDADYLIADDPHKVSEANNPNRLQLVREWWGNTMATRGNDPLGLRKVVIMQRIHEHDLSGHLLANDLGYEHLCLPAEWEPHRYYPGWAEAKEAKAKDPIVPTKVQQRSATARDPRVEEGELLWKERFNDEALNDLKKEIIAAGGQIAVAGQMQQKPAPSVGTIYQKPLFRYFKRYVKDGKDGILLEPPGKEPEFCLLKDLRFFQCCDTALTEKETSAFTSVGTFAFTPRRQLLVWHMWRERLEVPYQFAALMKLREGPHYFNRESRVFLPGDIPGASYEVWPRPLLFQAVEDKASGIGLIQQGQMEGRPFKVLKAEGDKVERSHAAASLYFGGLIYHYHGQLWLPEFESELLSFPRGAYKDQADVLAYAGILYSSDVILQGYVESHAGFVETEAERLRKELLQENCTTLKVRGQEVDIWWDRD